jgi:dCMP deaminase
MNQNKRITWDQVFMETAYIAAKRSTCIRRAVGAVLVKNNTIISTGYNGAPKKLPHCSITGCLRETHSIPSGERHEVCRGVHAEQNAIIQCATSGASCEGAVLYTTTYPCSICAKIIINAGITKVIYSGDYPDAMAKELFRQGQVEVIKYS